MTKRIIYLDWCPRPTSAKLNIVTSGSVKFSDFDFKEALSFCEDTVRYWVRSDGYFLFEIQYTEDPSRKNTPRQIAHVVSGQIKSRNGHTHIFDADRTKSHTSAFPTITISPVELDIEDIQAQKDADKANAELKKILSSDQLLHGLQAKPSDKRPLAPAVYMIRIQFAKIFEKVNTVKKYYQDKRLNLYFKKIRPKAFNVVPILLLYLIATLITVIAKFSNAIVKDGTRITFDTSKEHISELTAEVLGYAMQMLIPVLIALYIINVSIKRRKILQAIRKGRGFMKFGSIYVDVLNKVCENTAEKCRPASDFQGADAILEMQENSEYKKRATTQFILVVLFWIASAPTYYNLREQNEYLGELITIILGVWTP